MQNLFFKKAKEEIRFDSLELYTIDDSELYVPCCLDQDLKFEITDTHDEYLSVSMVFNSLDMDADCQLFEKNELPDYSRYETAVFRMNINNIRYVLMLYFKKLPEVIDLDQWSRTLLEAVKNSMCC